MVVGVELALLWSNLLYSISILTVRLHISQLENTCTVLRGKTKHAMCNSARNRKVWDLGRVAGVGARCGQSLPSDYLISE